MRTLQEIIDSIDATKNESPLLADSTNNPSAVSIYGLLRDTISTNILLHEDQFRMIVEELEKIAEEAVSQVHAWYQRRMLAFQYGSVVQIDDELRVFYPVVNEDQKIIRRCSVKNSTTGDRAVIKVAKIVDGKLAPLNTEELNAAKAYLDAIAPSGVPIRLVSLLPDRLRVSAKVYFDGQYIESNVKVACIAALNDFLSKVDFDGVVYWMAVADALQRVPGVKDVEIISMYGRPEQQSATDPKLLPFNRAYELSSGYCILEDAEGLKPEDTLQMVLFNP